jgi:23S rRNA (uracil1939-C5)-methyltransferase
MKLHIEKCIYGGAGLARVDGKAVFVPFTLPGEVIEAAITKDSGSYANAELIEILDASPARASAPCQYFEECGGCHYQHATYAEQLEIKRNILRETLERAHLSELPEINTLHNEPLHYRNRIRLHLDRATSSLCYKKRNSNVNLPVSNCPIAAPILEQALQSLTAQAGSLQLGRFFEEIELFTNDGESTLLVSLWTKSGIEPAKAQLKKLWPLLQIHLPQISGAAVFSIEQGKHASRMLAQAGDATLTYRAAGEEYRVSNGSFFQVNRLLIDPLIELAIKEASGNIAWDLYAGAGLFARKLATAFQQVIAVEAAPSSVADLRHNLPSSPHRVIASSTLEFLRRSQTNKHPRPDFVIVDPPRAGLGKDVTELLIQIRPTHITYVSCDPATLSRDLKSLLDSGYHLQQIHLVDMFPQTFHMERVVRLSLP